MHRHQFSCSFRRRGTGIRLVLGRAGGRLQTGRVLDYRGKPNRKMCSLYLSIMDRMGLKLPAFGDARERLAGI